MIEAEGELWRILYEIIQTGEKKPKEELNRESKHCGLKVRLVFILLRNHSKTKMYQVKFSGETKYGNIVTYGKNKLRPLCQNATTTR